MLFNSFIFWITFPFLFALCWLIPQSKVKLKRGYLILVSYLLYINFNPAYALLLAGVTLITYRGGGICLILSVVERNGCWRS